MMTAKPEVFFISGTDTDVGKTFISCGILESAALMGLSCAAIKPVAAGGVKTDAGLHNEDALALQQRCNPPLSYEQVNPLCLELPVAPHIAAEKENRTMKVAQLAELCRDVMMKQTDITIIEGAGGWRIPLNSTEYYSDLVKALNVPVILVVAMRLGCINHALLTVQSIQAEGVQLAGWVANQMEPEMPVYDENVQTLKLRISAPLLAEISYEDNFSASSSCASQINMQNILRRESL